MGNRTRTLLGLLMLALSFYLYLLYQGIESFPVGISSVALFAIGLHLSIKNVRFLEPFRKTASFLVVGATASLALVALNLQTYVDSSSYSAFLASVSARFTAFLMTTSGVSVRVSNDVLIFPNGGALSIGPLCGGAYSTILFLLLSVVLVSDFGGKVPKRMLTVALVLGVLGANLANVFRITFLAALMYFYGVNTLEVAHQFAGYAVFLGFMSLFWWGALRWLNGAVPTGPALKRGSYD